MLEINYKENSVIGYNKLKEIASNNGMAVFGVADVRSIKNTFSIDEDIIENLNYGISIGCRVSVKILDSIKEKPNKLYLHHYKTINALLDQTGLKIANFIQNQGYDALPVSASVMLDWQTPGAHLSHKLVGYHAGVGWRGKNSLLVNPLYGSKVRYSTILTNFPLIPDKPLDTNCGDCHNCMDNCPVQAITEDGYDLEKCHTQLKIYQNKDHLTLICGLCVKCCNPY